MSDCQILIAGARGGTNIGESMYEGGRALGIRAELIDANALARGPWLLSRLLWHVFDRRTPGLARFQRTAVRSVRRLRPAAFLAVGFGLMQARSVREIRRQGVRTLVFLSDDPWAKSQRSRWTMRALREFDIVLTPRHSIIADLHALGCRDVRFLPFAYDPRLFYPEPAGLSDPALASDVIFVGGGDADRAPWIGALRGSGHKVKLYGGYWDRFPQTRGMSSGQASPDIIRRATSSAKVALCLVRRANRDGHVMRSFEIPAVGTCMLTEDTEEHRALFGPEGENVLYFKNSAEMLQKLDWLLAHDTERERMAHSARALVSSGEHSYGRRLQELVAMATSS